MNITKKIDSNKIILFILVAFMILPSTISIVGVSMFKIATVIIAIMSVYLFVQKKEEIKKALRNVFVVSNFILAIIIATSLLVNCLTVQFNDVFEIVRYIVFAMITVIVLTICQEEKYKIFLLKTISILMIIISILGGYPMKNNSNTLGLHNMNGLSADDKRTCALNDMNCSAGQPEQNASLQDMNAANEQPDMACSITNMNCRKD